MEVLDALERLCEDDRLRRRVDSTVACVERTLDLYGLVKSFKAVGTTAAALRAPRLPYRLLLSLPAVPTALPSPSMAARTRPCSCTSSALR